VEVASAMVAGVGEPEGSKDIRRCERTWGGKDCVRDLCESIVKMVG
jgi:hypothetical protein